MPVIDHDVHPSVIQRPNAVYRCWNRYAFVEGFWLKVREISKRGKYKMVDKFIPHKMSTECRYDMSLTDSKCNGCKHRGSGEAYDKQVREKGLK